MPVVKGFQARKIEQSAIVMDLSDLERQAAAILADARAQADQLLAHARTHAEADARQIRETARAAGQQEGFNAGLAEGQQKGYDAALAETRQQLADVQKRWTETLDIFLAHMPVHLAETKTDIIKLALAIAEKITRTQAAASPAVARQTVAAALELVGQSRAVAVHVAPAEVDALEAFLPELLTKFRNLPDVALVPDPAVDPGGCLVNFGQGQVDARLQTQIDRITAELLATET